MSEIERIGVTPRWSDVVIHGDTIYLVEVADQTLEGDITAQTQEVLASIERRLQAVGSGKHRLLQVLIYLPDLADLPAMNALWMPGCLRVRRLRAPVCRLPWRTRP